MSSSELVFNGIQGDLFKSNAVQSACPLLKECNTESAEDTSLERLCINEKNRIISVIQSLQTGNGLRKKSAKADVK